MTNVKPVSCLSYILNLQIHYFSNSKLLAYFQVKLVQHTYSNLFGTFLCNTAKEREVHGIADATISVWKFLRSAPNKDKFRNNLYISCDKVSLSFPNHSLRISIH